ncbi:MAG TPA: Nif3-like dinuclear metal center hexameric protein [Firmicutes bacterium]|nr:Nif3-like dinuclear metal center hexameric protein [Bacillota bacterium]
MTTVREVAERIEKWAPKTWAAEWDNVGLQLGDSLAEVKRILVCLDLTPETAKEAIDNSCDLVCCHHPLFFKHFKALTFESSFNDLVRELIKHDIAVYSAHTNLDIAPGGVEDTLAETLELSSIKVLNETYSERLYKIVVFVPEGYEDAVRNAMSEAGAGWIGNYSHCTFQVAGTGTFKPLEGTHPFIGSQGNIEKVKEFRLETVVNEMILDKVVSAMLEVHPYEEVAYDVYPLRIRGKRLGFGRVGTLKKEISFEELVDYVKERLECPIPKIVQTKTSARMTRIATACGSGSSEIDKAIAAGAQALITGDVKYHDALRARTEGLGIIDVGHYYTERIIIPKLAKYLEDQLGDRVTVVQSRIQDDVFQKKAHKKSLEIYVDGASSGNPGDAGIGLVIKEKGCNPVEKSEYIGQATNNVAEYKAVIRALEWAAEAGAAVVTVFSDSELVVNQLNGDYGIRDPELRQLFSQIESLLKNFECVQFVKVPREENCLADRLAKRASTVRS